MLRYEIEKLFGKKILVAVFIYVLFLVYVACEFYNVVYTDIPWSEFHNEYNFTVKGLILIISIVIAPLFASENECGMFEMLLVSKKACKEVPKAKIHTALIIVNIVTLLFLVVAVVSFGFGFGWEWNTLISEEKILPFAFDSFIQTNADLVKNKILHTLLAVNLVTLISLLVSAKIKNSMQTAIIMIVMHLIFSAGILATMLDSNFFSCLICSFPVNIMTQAVLHTEMVKVVGHQVCVIYIIDMVYIFFIGGLYCIMRKIYVNKRR